MQIGELQRGQTLSFQALNPSAIAGRYDGEALTLDSNEFRYRSYKAWNDLAEQLNCRISDLRQVSPPFVEFTFEKLGCSNRALTSLPAKEKYGAESEFARIDRLEEPACLFNYSQALERIQLREGAQVLALGVNRGDELTIFPKIYGADLFQSLRFTGVDHSASAIDEAARRFRAQQFQFFVRDLNELPSLALSKFDLVICLNTLQSPSVNRQKLLRELVQENLKPRCGVILGLPNCSYVGGEIMYGAKSKNYSEPELSLLIKDLAFFKKYLQQHKFKVTITGKYDVLVTGVR